jgi:hypothetical protein
VALERRREIRPLDVADIFEAAFGIWWRESWTLFAVVLVVTLPFQALTNLVQVSLVPEWYGQSSPFEFDPASRSELEPDEVRAAAGAAALAAILAFASYALAQAGCFKVVADAYLGGRPTWRGSLAFALRRAPSVLWLLILQVLLLMLAFLLLVVPAIWLAFSWSVAIPALLAENARGRRALGRSFRLVRGGWWRTAGVVVIALVIAGFVAVLVTLPFNAIAIASAPDNLLVAFLAGTLAGTVGAVVSTPLVAAFVTLLYFDLRARKDGPDIELATS